MTRADLDEKLLNYYSAERRAGTPIDLAFDRMMEFAKRIRPFANDNKSIGEWNTECAAVARELLEA